VLLLLFNDLDRLCDFIECFVFTAVEQKHRCLFQKSEFLAIVVINIQLLLDAFHFIKVRAHLWVFLRFQRLVKLSDFVPFAL
jgi:hypothetical protein